MIWNRDDSTPFREPVDLIEHPGNNDNPFTAKNSFTNSNALYRLPGLRRYPDGPANCQRRTNWR